MYLKVRSRHMAENQPLGAEAGQVWQACICAQQQAMHDIPYVEVGEARPFQYHPESDRWYIEVDLKHHDESQGAAIALYRVWRLPSGDLVAFKVDIREAE